MADRSDLHHSHLALFQQLPSAVTVCSSRRLCLQHDYCSEAEKLVHRVQRFCWCSHWVLTPSAMCTCVRLCMHVCYSTVFDVYSIGLCMSLCLSMFLRLSFSADIWTGGKQLCLLQSPLGFIADLHTHIHTHWNTSSRNPSSLIFPQHRTSRYTLPTSSSTSLNLFKGENLEPLSCLCTPHLYMACVSGI